MAADWDCEAYGPESAESGALCFAAGELDSRKCRGRGECHQVMTAERERVFRLIGEGAASGDPIMVFLAGEFGGPGQLLGGGRGPEQ